MAKLTYEYVYFAAGPHTRQPRTVSGSGGFASIKSEDGGTYAQGDVVDISEQPASQTVNGNVYPFSFMNLSGGTPGGVVSFDASNGPSTKVGTDDLVLLVVYAPEGDGGGHTNPDYGATIDSFDTTTGALFDDTFVKVSPDAGGTLTTSGNVEGYVDTTASGETIMALSPTSPTNVDFIQWLTLPKTVSTSPNLAVGKGISVSALAMYKTPPPVVTPPPDPCAQAVAGLNQLIAIGVPGPRLPISDYNAIVAQLEKCVAEGKLTQAFVTELLARYKAYAAGPETPPGGGLVKP